MAKTKELEFHTSLFAERYLLGAIPEKLRLTKSNIDDQIEKAITSYAEDKFAGHEVFELLKHVID